MNSQHSSRTASPAASAESTVEELKSLLAQAERALANAGERAVDESHLIRARLRNALDEGKVVARRAMDSAREKAAHADEAIHSHPYIAIGIAAGVGAMIGAMVARNCRSQQ